MMERIFNKPIIMNVNNLVGLDSLNVFLVFLDVIQVPYVPHYVHSRSEKSSSPPEEILGVSVVFVIHVHL